MGTPFAVTFACLYIHSQSINYDTLMYARYIDDIFAIFYNETAANEFIKLFNELRPNKIKLIVTNKGNSVDILDLKIFKGDRFANERLLDTKIFQKPQNKYLYLPISSCHRSNVFKAFIQAELKRYRISCTSDDDFTALKKEFRSRLLNRGYTELYLDKIFNIEINRNELLFNTVKNRNNVESNTPIIFKTTYTNRQKIINLKKCLELTEALWTDPKSHRIFQRNCKHPILCFKRTHNLKELLTKAKYSFIIKRI
jgi:hypothetical protein